MKKQLRLIGSALAVTLLLFACGKEQKQTTGISEQFKRVDQIEDERLLFSLLSAEEKAGLASQHLDFCAEYYQFTDAQMSGLAVIKSKLLAAYSAGDGEMSAEVGSVELDVNQYFSSLSEEQRQVIFNSMVVDAGGVQRMIASTGSDSNASTDCNCSSSSNFCSSSWGPSILCDKASKCGKSSWGCGTLWLYSCNGKCKLFS